MSIFDDDDMEQWLIEQADSLDDYENRCEADVPGGVCLRRLNKNGTCPDHG